MSKKITYSELRELFCDHEKNYPTEHLVGYIVFTEGSFDKDYTKESRTYIVSSDNKAFQPNKCGYSIYASCLDGTDPCVRLEQYIDCEYGGKDGWHIDYCYI